MARRSLYQLRSVAAAAGITFAASSAYADERAACADAAEEGQRRRDTADLLAARERFVFCARHVCPSSVQRSCATWLDELEPRIPSIVVGLRDDAGQDVIDGRLLIDGVEARGGLDGTAVPLNPGVHELAIVSPGGQRTVVKVMAREGEKARRIDVREALRRPSSRDPSRSTEHPNPAAPARSGLPLWPAFAFAGLSVAGFVTYGVLDADARATYDDLQKTCSPNCTSDQLSSLRTSVTLSDVGLGVGIGSAVLAAGWLVVSLVTNPSASAAFARPPVARF